MKSLIIYDNSGYIYSQMEGSYVIPKGGVQYLQLEIPTGKILRKFDITKAPHVPIYEDIPLTENELLKKRIEEQELALVELASLLGGAV